METLLTVVYRDAIVNKTIDRAVSYETACKELIALAKDYAYKHGPAERMEVRYLSDLYPNY